MPDAQARSQFYAHIAEQILTPFDGVKWTADGKFVLQSEVYKLQNTAAATMELVPIAKAEPAPPKKLSAKQLRALHEYDESVFRRLRMLLREFCTEVLRSKEYKALVKNLNPLEDYGEHVTVDAQDILDKVERRTYRTHKPFQADLGHMVEGFRRLIFVRNDMYRLTHLNALQDLLAEWCRTFDPKFVHEVGESAAREKRLRKDYAALKSKQDAEQLKFYMSLRKKHQDDGINVVHFEDDMDMDTDRKRSGRLRGQEPVFTGIELVNTRKMRIIESTDDEDVQPGDEPEVAVPATVAESEEA